MQNILGGTLLHSSLLTCDCIGAVESVAVLAAIFWKVGVSKAIKK